MLPISTLLVGVVTRTCKPVTGHSNRSIEVRVLGLSPAGLWLWLRSAYGGGLMLVGHHVTPLRSAGSMPLMLLDLSPTYCKIVFNSVLISKKYRCVFSVKFVAYVRNDPGCLKIQAQHRIQRKTLPRTGPVTTLVRTCS